MALTEKTVSHNLISTKYRPKRGQKNSIVQSFDAKIGRLLKKEGTCTVKKDFCPTHLN